MRTQTHIAQARRSAGLRVALLFGPLIMLVVLLRLLEYSILTNETFRDPGLIVWQNGPLLLLMLLLPLPYLVWARRQWPRVAKGWLAAGGVLLAALLLFAASLGAPWWMATWLKRPAFELVRWDVLFLLGAALVFWLLLARAHGWAGRLVTAALYGFVPGMMLLAVFEYSYFVTTGLPGDGELIEYFARHFAELMPLIASEVAGIKAVLLALPLVLMVASLLVMRLPVARRWVQAAPAASLPLRQTLGAALPVLLVLLLLPSAPLPDDRDAPRPYAGLLAEMLPAVFQHSAAMAAPAGRHLAPFDARAARLVATDSTRRMNIVVILLESARPRSLTPYNPSLDTTPFLDSLAKRSLLVERMYSVVAHTNKTFPALFAGIYPYPKRDMRESAPGGIPAPGLPDLLRPLGYRSAFFTSAYLAYERKDMILYNLGFDVVRGAKSMATDGFYEKHAFGFEDDTMIAPSLAWVDEAVAADQPFLLGFLTLNAHYRYDTPRDFPTRDYSDDFHLNQYLNALRLTDAFLEKLLHGFAERGLLEETLFILVGDHGEGFGEHGVQGHNVVWDEVLHVPCLLYNPRLFPEGGRIAGPRSQTDLLPTITDALGLRMEGGTYPARSLLRPVPPGRTLYHSSWHADDGLALRQDSLKFLYYYRRRPMQVFDVKNDPLERRDIADQIPLEQRKAAEIELILWREGVEQMYHTDASSKSQAPNSKFKTPSSRQ